MLISSLRRSIAPQMGAVVRRSFISDAVTADAVKSADDNVAQTAHESQSGPKAASSANPLQQADHIGNVPNATYRRALRRAAKDPVAHVHGPFFPGRRVKDAVMFGALRITAPSDEAQTVGRHRALRDAAQQYVEARNKLHADPDARSVMLQFENGFVAGRKACDTTVRISPSIFSQFTPLCGSHLLIDWNPHQGLMPSRGKAMSAILGLAHELFHAFHYVSDPAGYMRRISTPAGFMDSREEALTHARETITAFRCDDGHRKNYYDAAFIHVDDPAVSVDPADAPWAAAKARLHAVTRPNLRAFLPASRQHILRRLERASAQLPAEQQPIAQRELRQKYVQYNAVPSTGQAMTAELTRL